MMRELPGNNSVCKTDTLNLLLWFLQSEEWEGVELQCTTLHFYPLIGFGELIYTWYLLSRSLLDVTARRAVKVGTLIFLSKTCFLPKLHA
jgi:hypothetical protein